MRYLIASTVLQCLYHYTASLRLVYICFQSVCWGNTINMYASSLVYTLRSCVCVYMIRCIKYVQKILLQIYTNCYCPQVITYR